MRPAGGLPSLSRRGRILLLLAVLALAGLIFIPLVVELYTDWLWFGEVGYRSVWATVLTTRVLIFLVVAVVVGGAVVLAVLLAYRSRPLLAGRAGPDDPVAAFRAIVARRPRLFGLGIPVLVGLFCGLGAQASWMTVQLFLHGGSFGVADPQFGHDVGFYVFDLPFYRSALDWLFAATFLAFLASLGTHALFGGVRVSEGSLALTRAARIQLAVLLGTLILLKAVAYWLNRYARLSSGRKEPTFTGGGYTDINAVLPARMILCAIAVLCAAAFFAAIVVRDLRIPAMTAILLVLSSLLVGVAWPLAVEQFSVRPNAADRESPYIERNIEATRMAYGIGADKVAYQAYPGIGTKSPHDVPADVTTLANARLLDPNVLSHTFIQQQQLKNFYAFPPTLDLDRYVVDGQLRDYVVAARELTPSSLSGNQTQWVNQHTVYTHGDGFVAAPANRVNAAVREATGDTSSSNSGYPVYTVSDIATGESGHQVIRVDQPRIYFGEMIAKSDPDYAVVGGPAGDGPREYDTDAAKYTYAGSGGVPIGNWFNRVAFALEYTERNIVFSKAIGPGSKIIFNRDPTERVHLVAPWLTADHDPYPAVVGGRIVWIVDAYTAVDNYPYAQRSSLDALAVGNPPNQPGAEVSYIRNSVKATVDAYDGTVTLYQVDRQDPVLKAWMSAFPGTVRPADSVPDELRAHFRYPEDLFKIQREMLAKYHVDDPREFFTTNAFWGVPSDPTVETNPYQMPFYVLVGDQQTAAPSFRLASAMVGFRREFLAAYISANSDPADYGKITVLQLPTDALTQGPQQIQNSMISDTRVASERTLLERSNRIQYGNLLTLPIADGGALYVEPLFTERIASAQNVSTFPQLARMLVSYREPGATGGVRVGYAPTLGEALDQIFGSGTGNVATPPGGHPGQPPPIPGAPALPPTAAPAPPDPAKAALDAAIAQLREAVDRLQKAIDAYQTAGK
ncbi:hypothetical protein SAMN05444580_106117 [Rhodococcus tukisamuensis]|uniref:UPF0182 protein SAMN05444580_106117 n=2 Tax=Rhodococcus tukisamuensis TaxID=168276 RepID=A0A1G6X7Y3_9NOCA|nr:hypothetical protein SAMN05444580_106117 [Rhodococcus tukisamuensis]